MINIKLPDLEFKNLPFEWIHNVSNENRAEEFESQNEYYRSIGFNESNTSFGQTFDVGSDINSFARTLFSQYSVSVIKQLPGHCIPVHTDTYYTFAKNNKVDKTEIVRVNIFLERWKTGHYFEVNNTPILNWRAGDAIILTTDKPHLSANAGIEPKYTMQITGLKHEFTRSKASL